MVSLSSLLGPWTDTWPLCTKELASKASCSSKLCTKPIELHFRRGERAAFHPICAEGGKRSQLIHPFIVHQQGRCNGTISADKFDFLDNRWHANVSPSGYVTPQLMRAYSKNFAQKTRSSATNPQFMTMDAYEAHWDPAAFAFALERHIHIICNVHKYTNMALRNGTKQGITAESALL